MPSLDGLMGAIARKYGVPPAWLASELEDYIRAELDTATPDSRERIYRAISRACRMSDGYPDVAAARSAIWQYAKDGLGDLVKPLRKDWSAEEHAPPPPDEELMRVDWQEIFRQAKARAEERHA